MPEKNGQPTSKTSGLVLWGSIMSFASLTLLVMAYASPYWLVSWQDTYSPFKNMGLWEFCFHRFRYWNYQYDKVFDGCNYIFSNEYIAIWEWLLPGWLMAVQAFMTLALIFSLLAQASATMFLVRWPVKLVLRYQWELLSVTTTLNGIKAFCLFLAVAVFGGQCWRRNWLLYPNFNYLSWSYGFAAIGMLLAILATLFFYLESKAAWFRRKENTNLVVQMQAGGSHTYI